MDVKTVVQVLMQQRDRLVAYVWTLVGDVQLAEDTLQDLAILAMEKGIEVEDEVRLVVWLRRAARLKALETLHKLGRPALELTESTLEQIEASWADRHVTTEGALVESLRECVRTLSPNNRRILTERYVEGRKPAEIAIRLGRSATAVYKALFRLHRALRDCMLAKTASVSAHD